MEAAPILQQAVAHLLLKNNIHEDWKQIPPRPTPAPGKNEEKLQRASPGVLWRALNGSLKAN